MAESKRRPRKLKGAVLIMVVTLLFVLIVMLLATLTVVSNANRRTVTKYEENQAYYTARSALEVYIDEMLEDEAKSTAGSTVKQAWEAAGFTFDADASYLADNLSNNKDFNNEDLTYGFVHQQLIFGYLTPKYKLKTDMSGNLLADGDLLDPKDAGNWEEKTDGVGGYDADDSYVEYTAELPKTDVKTGAASDGSNVNIGKIADDDKVDIKVELLRIVYIGKDGNVLTDGSYVTSESDNLDGTKIKMSQIDWNKTYIRLKVTATTTISDNLGAANEATISVLLEPSPVINPKGFNNAMTSMNSTLNNCKVFTLGGASASMGSSTYTIPNNSTLLGNYVYGAGEVLLDTTTTYTTPAGSYFVVEGGIFRNQNGDFTITGNGNLNETDSKKLAERPFFYAEGIALYKAKVGTGNSSACDLIAVKGSGTLKDKTWIPDVSGVTGIDKSDAALVITQSGNEFYGDVYCDGDMYITADSCKFYGKVYCTGNIYITGNANGGVFDVLSQVYVGGDIYDGSGNIIDASNSKLGTPSLISKNDLTTAAYSDKWNLDPNALNDDKKMEIDLPHRGVTAIPPVENVQDPYVYDDDDASKGVIPAGKSAGDIISASEMLNNNISGSYLSTDASLTVNSSAPSLKASAESGSVSYSAKYANGTTANYSYSGNIIDPAKGYLNNQTGFYEFKWIGDDFLNDTGTYYIDATTSSVQIQITGTPQNSAQPKFVIVGDKSVVFTIADNDNVLVNDTSVLTAQIYEMLNNGSIFNIGDTPAESDSPTPPNVYFYIGTNSQVTFDNASNLKISGYMYGPEAKFYANTNHGTNINFKYNGDALDPSSTHGSMSLFGSMVFGDIETQNELGVAFISPSSDQGSATGTRIKWDRQRYLGR